MGKVKLWIDGQEVEVPEGTTVLKAAEEAGVHIPTLCYHPLLRPSGNCRMCAVEIEGYRGLPASCSTPVAEGMVVRTNTDRVRDFRQETLRAILRDHPRECIACPKNQSCELQELIAYVGIEVPYEAPSEKRFEVKDGGPFFRRDYNLCVRCGRCVRICNEVRGAGAIVFKEVEGRQEVGTPLDRPLEEVGCQFCAACVDVCPTGALMDKIPKWRAEAREKEDNFCPEISDIVLSLYDRYRERESKSSICPYCGVGCRLVFEVQDGEIIRTVPDPNGPANKGLDCVKGRFGISEFVHSPDRLKTPLIRKNGSLEETSWDEALEAVAKQLSKYKPDEVAVISSAKCTNEENYVIQKFARAVLKTNSVDHCARL